METKLDQMLSSIDPDRTIVETFNRANTAINTFPMARACIDQWDQFKYCMAELIRHVDFHSLGLKQPVQASSEDYWALFAERVLRDVYGPSGAKAAFEMARTGCGGGLRAVIRAVAMHIAEGYAKKEIAAKVNAYWNRLSVDEQFSACTEYLSKYGSLLPSEITEANAARIRADFPKVLKQHPWLLRKTHNVGR
jgi:hypothetical protein